MYSEPLPLLSGKPLHFVNSEGLLYEAAEATRCVRAGILEPPAFDAAACLNVMKVISEIRAHWQTPRQE